MDPAQAIVTRRSVTKLTGPAPSDDELIGLLQQAVTAPDHGLLRPWRLVVVRGEARHVVGAALALASADQRAADKALRAPLLLSIVFRPRASHKVPEWEQIAATSAMVQNLCLLLHINGWGSIWRTGSHADSPEVRSALELDPSERSLGWLYVGTPDPVQPVRHVPLVDVRAHISTLDEKGRLQCA